jgi:topoisomerase-4 subunit B
MVARDARAAARKARENVRKLKSTGREILILSGKLTPAQSKNPKEKELFLVEGDSAGGTAKLARDKFRQAILPLRGKVMNVEKAKLHDLLVNEEICTIISTLGTGIGDEFKLENLKYDKVIIMTDADTDGAHIQVLLLTFFYRFMKPLIENHKVYIALPPLYRITNKNSKAVSYA